MLMMSKRIFLLTFPTRKQNERQVATQNDVGVRDAALHMANL